MATGMEWEADYKSVLESYVDKSTYSEIMQAVLAYIQPPVDIQ